MKKAVFSIIVFALLAGATFATVEIADWLLLNLQSHSLLFPARKTIVFQGEEGIWSVHTNWLGLRDPETHRIVKRNRMRVAAIGTSVTFGWGVNDQDAWPLLLETELGDADVWNLSRPGAGLLEVADTAESLVDYLHPDLILVSVVQAGDVNECTRRSHPSPESLMGVIKRWLPGFALAADQIKKKPLLWENFPEQIAPVWREQAISIVGSFTPAQKERYEKIPEQTRTLFMAGSLNPFLIDLAVKKPSYHVDITKDNPEIEGISQCLRDVFLRIRAVAQRNQARVLVASTPLGIYTSRELLESRAALGFDLGDDFLVTRKPDDIIARAAKSAGLAFVAFTDQFRQEALRQRLFLKWDGHLSRAGNKVLSQLIAAHLRSQPNLELSDVPPSQN